MSARVEALPRIGMAALFVGIGVVGAVLARDFSPVGQWFPFYTSLGIAAAGSTVLVREALSVRQPAASGSGDSSGVPAHAHAPTPDAATPDAAAPEETKFTTMLLWWLAVVGFAGCVYVTGLFVAAPVFIFLALFLTAGVRWFNAGIAAIVSVGALWLLTDLLQLPLPEGLFG